MGTREIQNGNEIKPHARTEADELRETESIPHDYADGETHIHTESLADRFKALFTRREGDSTEAEKKLASYIEYLDNSTASSPDCIVPTDIDEYTDEELRDIWNNDPGYVNELAFKRLPKETKEEEDADDTEVYTLDPSGAYMQTGYHSDFSNYHSDAVEGTERTVELKAGTILERRGNENGRYFSKPDTEFEALHLNVSEDKLEKHLYTVLKPFVAEESVIKEQPFSKAASPDKDGAIQYKTRLNARELIETGYIREIKDKEA